jgi:uncharacterized protein YecE (DUF72 family)
VSGARAAPPELKPVRIGCSGWNYAHWRELVYPKGLPTREWLPRYAELFDTVEVNATFYRLPRPESVRRWVEQTPPDFVFAIKASRYLTHVKRLREVPAGAERMREAIAPLLASPKMGPILWQLPEQFHRDDESLAAALEALPPGRHAFEFRHPSWFCDPIYELLESHGVALVIGDHPARPFQTSELTAEFTFIRFHYGRRGRGGNYSEGELRTWAERIEGWRRRADVYAYFNNDWQGFAITNGLRLRELSRPDQLSPRLAQISQADAERFSV